MGKIKNDRTLNIIIFNAISHMDVFCISILYVTIIVTSLVLVTNTLYGGNMGSINDAKRFLERKIITLHEEPSNGMELSNRDLDEILEAFSGIGYTFEELAYEFLKLSKKLKKSIKINNASNVFNKFKKNKGRGIKYAKFDTLEYDGLNSLIYMQFTPNSEDGEWYVEHVDDREVYYKEKSVFSVVKIAERKVKVKTGVFSSDRAYINSGISFKPVDNSERIDSMSILGILPMTELILILEGDSEGETLRKGSLVTIIANKYGQIYTEGDYIDQ